MDYGPNVTFLGPIDHDKIKITMKSRVWTIFKRQSIVPVSIRTKKPWYTVRGFYEF
jgi:hypothetical protein